MEIEEFKSGEEICVVNLPMSKEGISCLQKWILNKSKFTPNTENDCLKISLFKFIGNNCKVTEICNISRNREYGFKKTKSLFRQSSSQNFITTVRSNRRFVFELVYDCDENNETDIDMNVDVGNFQYLFLTLSYLLNKSQNFNVFIFGKSNTKSRYTSINYSKFGARARAFLSLCSRDKIYSKILERIKVYTLYQTESKRNEKWQKIIGNEKKSDNDEQAGKIFPLIPITQETYEALTKDFRSVGESIWCDSMEKLCKEYLKKTHVSNTNLFEEITKTDSYLEKILFFSTVAYCFSNCETNSDDYYVMLHEICNDYSQGIAQLIENALIHAVLDEDRIKGSASFFIRIRNKNDAQYLKEKNKVDAKYIMEIYIADLQYNNFQSIVNKFQSNLEKRSSSNKEALTELLKVKNQLNLKHLFGDRKLKELDDYLCETENIVFHYGLQILKSIVDIGQGFIYVRSDDCYSNINTLYYNQNLEWERGTAYIIYLPFQFTGQIQSADSIAVTNVNSESKLKAVSLNLNWNSIEQKIYKNKSDCIHFLKDEIMKGLNRSVVENKIGVVDCTKCKISYEILAKAIFMCFANSMDSAFFEHIALINVKNRHEVVKIFRQFALFYDRNGQNKAMKNKSVFIVDADAQIDLLLCDSVESIKNNMQIGQINGGLDSIAADIIIYLANSKIRREE